MIQKISIATITVGQRHRKEMGDLNALAQSIQQLGMLQPIGVTSTMQLVWGERRLKACQMLGWTEIEAVIDPSLDDIVLAMQAEKDENSCRLPFTHSEQVAIADQIESIERQQAEDRKQQQQQERIKTKSQETGQFSRGAESAPLADQSDHGKTREKVAAAVGMSHDTLVKARKVVTEGTPELVDAMDKGTASVNAAAQIASLPPQKQREVVAGGKKAIASAATKIRTASGSEQKREPRHPNLHRILERLDTIAKLRPTELHIGALREALADLRKELGTLLS